MNLSFPYCMPQIHFLCLDIFSCKIFHYLSLQEISLSRCSIIPYDAVQYRIPSNIHLEYHYNYKTCFLLDTRTLRGPPREARNPVFTQVFRTNHTQNLPEIYVYAKFTQSRWMPD